MKAFKKFFALLLATLMLSSLAVTAMAEGENTITITINNEAPNHVYDAYQVFSGTLSDTGVLSDVDWGSGVNGTNLLAALKSNAAFVEAGVNQFAAATDAAGVANVISKWSYNDQIVKTFADVVAANLTDVKTTSGAQENGKYVITVDVDKVGYYLIMDAQAVTGADAATDYLLQVVKSVEVAPKVSAPTFKKTVNNTLDGTYTEAMDAQIGDTVYFKLETTLPGLYNDYKQYVMIMEDVLPAGLEFNQVEDIYIAHAAGGQTSYFTNYTPGNNVTSDLDDEKQYGFADGKLTINFGDLKVTQSNPNLNDTITVKYSATVNADAVYGLNGSYGNTNTATLRFSNNMNQSFDEFDGENETDNWESGSLTDTANVYTYQLEVTKQDGLTKAPLKNAEFYLFRNFVEKDAQDNETTVKKYAHTDADGVITKWDAETPSAPLVSDEHGKFTIKGLDALVYHLEEVKAPDGYNTPKNDFVVTITSTISDHSLTALGGNVDGVPGTGDTATGIVSVAVNNTAGSTLPATGGIGTTIFYIVGGVLVLGAAAAFVMKRRNEA